MPPSLAIRLLASSLLLALAGVPASASPFPKTECEFTHPQPFPDGTVECRIEVRGPEEGALRTQTTSLRLGNNFELRICGHWPERLAHLRSSPGDVAFAQIKFSRPGSPDEHVIVLSHVETTRKPYLAFDRFSVMKGTWSLENPLTQLPEVPAQLAATRACEENETARYHFRIEGDTLAVYHGDQKVLEQWVAGYAWQNWGDPEITEVLVDDFRSFQMPRGAFVRTIWKRPIAD